MRDKKIEEVGRSFTSGAIMELGKWVLICWLLITAWGLIDDHFGITGRDSTDALTGPHSGLVIRTDALTGCEYLESSHGSLIARVRADGHQICTGAHQ